MTVLIQVGGRTDEGGCAALVTLLREALVRRLRRRTALRASGAETSTRLHNQSNPSTHQGSRKRFAKQRFFGKRRRNRTKWAGCLGKLPEKRDLRRRKCAGGQGAPLKRLQPKSTYIKKGRLTHSRPSFLATVYSIALKNSA